jgi:hypothetical protein
LAVALPAWRRRKQRKQAKLPHHSHIIPIRKVLGNLAIEHPIHVHVLNLESAPGRLHADEHPSVNRKVRRASVRAAVGASDNHPLALANRVQSRQPRVGEVGFNLSQHCPYASTPHLPTVVSTVLGEAACCRVEVGD